MTLYNDSKRIVGTNADRIGTSAISGGWKEIGRTTLGSAGDALTVSSFADKRYYMFLYNAIPSGEMTEYMTFGSSGTKDTGNNYVTRLSKNAGSDSTYNSRANIVFSAKSGGTQPEFGVGFIANKSDQEKMVILNEVNANSAGATSSNIPDRTEVIGKHVQTSNPLNVISFDNTGTGDYASGTECVVLGYDPDDTHTDNFWEQLASVELSSANATIDSGTITAKKYLWFQVYCAGSTASNRCHIRMNSLSTGIYADRYSSDGGSDSTDTSSGSARISNNNNTDPKFVNGFIINTSSNEKLGIAHEVGVNGATNAGAAPQRTSSAFKIATNTQATSLQIVNISGNWSAGSFLKVWGSN